MNKKMIGKLFCYHYLFVLRRCAHKKIISTFSLKNAFINETFSSRSSAVTVAAVCTNALLVQ
jgi:hypothetical protein